MRLTTTKKWFIFTAIALAVALVDIDITAVNLIIVNIAKSLTLPLSTVQWVIDGYTIAAAGLMAFGGKCGDVFGRKKTFLIALVFFAFASISVAMAQGAWSIVISRIIQGGCIAFTFPVGIIIVRDVFPERQHGFAIGLLISIAGISQGLGPLIGATIIHIANWRWVFFINLPLALLSFVLIYTFFPKQQVLVTNNKLQLLPLLSLIVGIFALITALNEINSFGVISIEFLTLIVISLLALGLFVHYELNSNSPLLDLKILMNKQFSNIITTRLFINLIYFSWLFLLGLLLQKVLGYSTLHAGFIMLSLTLAIAFGSIPVGRMIDVLGAPKLLRAGLLLMFVANVLLCCLPYYHSLVFLLASLLVAGASMALLIPASAISCMQAAPIDKGGVAMGVLMTFGFSGSAIGVALYGSLIEMTFSITIGFSLCMIISALLSLCGVFLCKKVC